MLSEKNSLYSQDLNLSSLIQDLVDDALWAPTPDNVQNWKFSMGGEQELIVEVDTERWKHPIDPFYHASILSLGGMYEYIRVAAAKLGLEVLNYRLEHSALRLCVELVPSDEVSKEALELYQFLRLRRTDRRSFKVNSMSKKLIEDLRESNCHYNSKVSFSQKPSKSFFEYLQSCEHRMWVEADIMLSTIELIEFSGEIPKIGFSYKNGGLSYVESKLIKLLSLNRSFFKTALALGLAKQGSRGTSKVHTKSGGFLLFSSAGTTNQDLFEVGRQAILCWLRLTKAGYVVQPLSFSSLSCFELLQEGKTPPLVEKNKSLFSDGIGILQREFDLMPGEVPCWLFRVGQGEFMSDALVPARLNHQYFFKKMPKQI